MALAYAPDTTTQEEKPWPVRITSTRRNTLASKVTKEISDYDNGLRKSVSSVEELRTEFGISRAAIYYTLSDRLDRPKYERWLELPKTGQVTREELKEALRQTIRHEIIAFWRKRIRAISTARGLAKKLNSNEETIRDLLKELPNGMVKHRYMLLCIQRRDKQARFRSIILQIHNELKKYRKDSQFRLTRNYTIRKKHRIFYTVLHRYLIDGLTLRQRKERTRILREQYKFAKRRR